MNLLLLIPGFILALSIVLLYECKIRRMSREPRNNVRFFVEKEVFNSYFLYIGNNDVMCYICSNDFFKKFGLNPDDFADMKKGEIKEVFLNLED